MILVDIWVPALDQVYDFQLEESCTIALLTEEICEMIHQKEQISGKAAEKGALLMDAETQRMLPLNQTPAECGVQDGSRLILV